MNYSKAVTDQYLCHATNKKTEERTLVTTSLTTTNKPTLTILNILMGHLTYYHVKSASSHVTHTVGDNPGFFSIMRQGVFLLPPGWDASPSQGYPQH